MKIALYRTGHEINERITQSLWRGLKERGDVSVSLATDGIVDADVHIAYGILRGCCEVFKAAEAEGLPWFNVDRGMWGASHYGGLYRISHRGTQPKYRHFGIQRDHSLKLQPYVEREGYTLICPPSGYVINWIGGDTNKWLVDWALYLNKHNIKYKTRFKHNTEPVDWDNIKCLITYNSSIAIEAICRGIPVVSDKNNSVVGSFQDVVGEIHLDTTRRDMLLRFMSAHQFTLEQIEQGRIWEVLNHYLPCISAQTPEKQ